MKSMRMITIIIIISLLFVQLTGCSKKDDEVAKIEGKNNTRVTIISPPIFSIYLSASPKDSKVVGINERAFSTANENVLNELYPGYKDINTSFINNEFVVNTEELLKLSPDIIFYYGDNQKNGLDKLDVESVDMMISKNRDPEQMTIQWEKHLEEAFNISNENTIEKEWQISNKKADELLKNNSTKKKGLYVFSYINRKITVSGNNSYGDNFFNKAGIENVAKDIEGCKEVSMEQIYEWNPDIVFIFLGMPATPIINNKVTDQDWSLIQAYKDKAIYDIPQAVYSWGAPNADSPLMPLWLISKTYSNVLNKDEFITYLKGYYNRIYDIELNDELVEDILKPKEVKGK
ncbi:ABC transporter substrate-binding protein [Vallitalea sp.]|jgi:iron complex transport system substrate-binding protein|uniref:ABC transporter substrate-binding protein n=1 Tax=Vallitalea sp. TaxID=1882829 RepID=UPI0025E47429|nr:ABC transporter substrate-binding protein [Vallitalea sp.]MCT4688465.1 ABC transporter substrate-binding protein [Vallitalea sp.]